MNLKQLRKNEKLTQSQLANKCGITLRSYQNYESGDRQMSYDTLKKIASFFNCSIDYLLGYRVNETPLQQKLISSIKSLDSDLCELANAYIEGLKATQRQRDMIRERVKQNGINENID